MASKSIGTAELSINGVKIKDVVSVEITYPATTVELLRLATLRTIDQFFKDFVDGKLDNQIIKSHLPSQWAMREILRERLEFAYKPILEKKD